MKIHVTGGFGFIGSNLIRHLNKNGIIPIVYDHISPKNWWNVRGLQFEVGDLNDLYTTNFRANYNTRMDILVHLGANVDTTEQMNQTLWFNNYENSTKLFQNFYKVIYASSAATYGAEEKDFSERIDGLIPLNAYAFSKWMLDSWAFGPNRNSTRGYYYGLRFFNVYGPNEAHKGDMKSVVSKMLFKERPMCRELAHIPGRYEYSLFKSGKDGVGDGEQKRDFVYVEDVCDVILFFIQSEVAQPGVYNVGSGQARTFNDLVKIVDPNYSGISYVTLPPALVGNYQYFTQADLTKLRKAGYKKPFTSLEEGVAKTKALTFGASPKESS